MKKRAPIVIRLFSESMSEEERAFYGVPEGRSPWPTWPPLCVNCGEPAAGGVPAAAERKGDEVRLEAPVCARHRDLKHRRYGWVTSAGLWLSYVGVTGFFVTLYFAFSMSEASRGMSDGLFLLSLVSLATAFFGFYFVRLVQSISRDFREWLQVPALSLRIVRSTPYFRDLALRFGGEEVEQNFIAENDHLLAEKLDVLAAQRRDEALAAARSAGDTASAQYEFGLALERLAEFEKAREAYSRVVELDPRHADGWRHLGACWFALSRPKEAEQAFTRALEIDANDADTLLLLSSLFELTNRPFHAESRLKQAAKLHEGDADIQFRLGDYLLRRRKVREAREAFERSLAVDPAFNRSLVGLGLTQAQMDDEDGFAATIERLRALSPDLAHRLQASVSMTRPEFAHAGTKSPKP